MSSAFVICVVLFNMDSAAALPAPQRSLQLEGTLTFDFQPWMYMMLLGLCCAWLLLGAGLALLYMHQNKMLESEDNKKPKHGRRTWEKKQMEEELNKIQAERAI